MVSGSRPASEVGSMRLSMARSYGTFAAGVERQVRSFAHMLVLGMLLMAAGTAFAQTSAARETKPIKVVVLGDSLSAGLGLSASSAFPARLQKSLKLKGIEVDMINAGVSGDNDALRGTDPQVTRSALTDILTRLKARKIAVLLCGMLAPPNFGSD